MNFWPAVAAFVFIFALDARAGVLARFQMSEKVGGTIDVELLEQDRPITVSNFIAYVKSDAWHDNIMHRWVQNFIIQGGSFKVPHDPTLLTPLSVNRSPIASLGNIPFEGHLGQRFSNVYGTIAMARVGTDTNSASLSWFFNVKDNLNLDTQDGGYTVFGRTLRGTNVLNRFKAPSGSTNIYFLAGGSIPVYSEDGATASWLNVDITILTARIIRVGSSEVQISWDSVEGVTNIVEYSTTVPPVWQTLRTGLGTGGIIGINDSINPDQMRQYRVRVEYSN